MAQDRASEPPKGSVCTYAHCSTSFEFEFLHFSLSESIYWQVERAFLSFLPQELTNKAKKGPAKFSHENFGPQLQTFNRRVGERVSERRWTEILACLVGNDQSDASDNGGPRDDNAAGDLTMISVNRGDFPSSPMKA